MKKILARLERFFEWQDKCARGVIPCWLHPVFRLKNNLDKDYINLVAAGIAFYFFMAAFPALASLVSLYGLFSDPGFIGDQLNLLSRFLPPEALKIFADQVQTIASSDNKVLGISLITGIIFATYSAAKGSAALIQGFNIVYDCHETRNFFARNFTSFVLTFVVLIYFLIALSLIAGIPVILQIAQFPDVIIPILLWSRWPLLFFSALLGLEILYYFGPSHKNPRWHWISWGSFIATLLWLLFSSLFSIFVLNFGRYNETYGSLGAVVVLLLWFWISAMMILIGAEINVLRTHKNTEGKETELLM